MKVISIILPCLNEADNLPKLIPEIIKYIPSKYQYEILCIDDGSVDITPDIIRKLAIRNKSIKGLILHRRFGHQAALLAGINVASGDAIITMDADFQHPPEIIPKLIEEWEKGHDVINMQKKDDRTTNILFRLIRNTSYYIWKQVSSGVLTPGVSDFRLIDQKIKLFIVNSEESEIFLRGVTSLAARNPLLLTYKVGKRKFGKSSYTLQMFLKMFINGFISFSVKPLRLATIGGLLIALFTAFFLGYDILSSIIVGKKIIEGWMTVVLLILIINGFIIFYLGILGEYLGVIFREVKKRPTFLIDKKINL